MSTITLYAVGQYGSPFTQDDRDRTVAALYVAQGGPSLGSAAMRRDVLNFLMSPSAVGYWLRQGWFEKSHKIGRLEYLRLTGKGASQCGSLAGPSTNVRKWMRRMTEPGYSQESKCFAPIKSQPDA